jgi:DNA damage-inducible protein 1
MLVQVLVVREDGEVASILLEDEETVENLKALVEVELGTPLGKQVLSFKDRVLENFSRLKDYGIVHDDVIQLSIGLPRTFTLSEILLMSPGEALETLKTIPGFVEDMQNVNPSLARAIRENKATEAYHLLKRMHQESQLRAQAASERQARTYIDPFSEEAQAAIEAEIRAKQIQESFEHALEYNPESFGSVFMLYIPVQINGHGIKAFVDSGAQSTIMSAGCAERCGLMRLVDKRFAGRAVGVGSAKILGRIHLVQMTVGKHFFPCSLTVLENDGVDFLFGLDMLKRHQAVIDLRDNCLRIGEEVVSFLPENVSGF